MVSTEHIISAIPLVIRRRVKFGDCDPAGVVHVHGWEVRIAQVPTVR